MSKYVVAISIDKVQSFLYYVLNAPTQDKQTNSGTLSTIIQSSRMISEQFYEDIGIEGSKQETFANHIDEQLLKSSGNCVFITSLLEAEIAERLKKLFRSYYKKFNGQLLMKYTYFPLESLKQPDPNRNGSSYQLLAIKESKRQLRADVCLSQIVEQNKELLFGFEGSIELPQGESSSAIGSKYPAFTKTINDLFDKKEADNENHFRIAVIKGDLDGMGELFKSIKNYELYNAVSNILSDYVSLDYLHQLTTTKRQATENESNRLRLYPLYMAGDDVFFAVPVHQLGDGISICKGVLSKLNKEIEQACKKLGHSSNSLELSMSIGVDLTFNREPIRYYYERVQRQLDLAKAERHGPEATNDMRPINRIKISINNFVFHDYMKEKRNQKIENLDKADENNANLITWQSMMNGVERLSAAVKQEFAAHHFLYGLLNKITDPEFCENELKYSNALFYHLIPQHLESENQHLRNAELSLLEAIMRQILRIKLIGRSTKGEPRFKKEILLNEQHKKKLEGYIRILLLFTDPRFNSDNQLDSKRFDATQAKSDLFTKPLKYIYAVSLGKSSVRPLREVFIKRDGYILDQGNQKRDSRIIEVEVYRTLRISNSLFHKIKHKYVHQPRVVGELIEAANPQTKDDVEERINQSKLEHKAPPGLSFEKELFLKYARSSQLWNTDYIDALMIFYMLKDKSIHLKEMIDFKTLKANQKQKRDRNHSGGRGNDSRKKGSSNRG